MTSHLRKRREGCGTRLLGTSWKCGKPDYDLQELLGNRCGVEEGEVVVEAPVVGAGLFAAAGYVEDELEELGADLLDGGVTGGDCACVEVDEIDPEMLFRHVTVD